MIIESQIVPFEVSPPPPGPWLVLAPHPDDESFGMGGSLLRAREEGIEADLLIMTDGGLGGSRPDLAEVRREEARRAAGMLGIRRLDFLDQPDRGLRCGDELAERLAEAIRASGARAVFFPGVFELHPDHRATSALAWRALGRLADPDILPVAYEISVQSPVNRFIDITAQVDGKRRVLDCYASQLGQNDYVDLIEALNRARTFTLPAGVSHAEGFFVHDPADTAHSLRELTLTRLSALFDP